MIHVSNIGWSPPLESTYDAIATCLVLLTQRICLGANKATCSTVGFNPDDVRLGIELQF